MSYHKVLITYCPKCKWLLRAAWMQQELLQTFEEELQEVTLAKGPSGAFKIKANDTVVWDRKREGGFPEITELKQLVRDVIAPEKYLGHSDKKNRPS